MGNMLKSEKKKVLFAHFRFLQFLEPPKEEGWGVQTPLATSGGVGTPVRPTPKLKGFLSISGGGRPHVRPVPNTKASPTPLPPITIHAGVVVST